MRIALRYAAAAALGACAAVMIAAATASAIAEPPARTADAPVVAPKPARTTDAPIASPDQGGECTVANSAALTAPTATTPARPLRRRPTVCPRGIRCRQSRSGYRSSTRPASQCPNTEVRR